MTNTLYMPHAVRWSEDGFNFDLTIKDFNLSKERPDFRSRFASHGGYKETVRDIIQEFHDMKPRDWRKGEIELCGIAGIEMDQFYSVVYYQAKFPPTHGDMEPREKIYKVLRWASGSETIGAVALLFTPAKKIILTHQYKVAAQEWMYEFPRGVADRHTESTGGQSARRIACNETGALISDNDEGNFIGFSRADTGLHFGKTAVVAFDNVEYDTKYIRARRDKTHSDIHVLEVTPAEIDEMIATDIITCGITMSTFQLARSKKVIQL